VLNDPAGHYERGMQAHEARLTRARRRAEWHTLLASEARPVRSWRLFRFRRLVIVVVWRGAASAAGR